MNINYSSIESDFKFSEVSEKVIFSEMKFQEVNEVWAKFRLPHEEGTMFDFYDENDVRVFSIDTDGDVIF